MSNITDPDIAVSLVDGSGREISDNASYWFNEIDGNIRVPLAGYKDAKGLSRMQLQNCGLDGFQFDGAAAEVCEGLFPSGTATDPLWRDRMRIELPLTGTSLPLVSIPICLPPMAKAEPYYQQSPNKDANATAFSTTTPAPQVWQICRGRVLLFIPSLLRPQNAQPLRQTIGILALHLYTCNLTLYD